MSDDVTVELTLEPPREVVLLPEEYRAAFDTFAETWLEKGSLAASKVRVWLPYAVVQDLRSRARECELGGPSTTKYEVFMDALTTDSEVCVSSGDDMGGFYLTYKEVPK